MQRRAQARLLRGIDGQLGGNFPDRLAHEAGEVFIGAPVGDGVIIELVGTLQVLGDAALT